MATNNTAGDFYNLPNNLSQDFEEFRFENLEVRPEEDWKELKGRAVVDE